MRILVVYQYFLMPGMPGGSRYNEFAKHWLSAGHDVTVIAGNLDYASGTTPERYRGRFITHEEQDGVEVLRCHVPATYRKSYLGRMWAFFGFTVAASVASLRVARPDVVISTSPALTIVIPGWLAAHARRRRVPWVFEIRDLWPESAITTGVLRKDGLLAKLLYRLERWACTHADKINVLTPAFADDLISRGLATADKLSFVPNGANPDEFAPGPRDNAFRREMGWGDKLVVLYAGAHGRANALSQLVHTAERLRDRPDILIACVGEGPERAQLIAESQRRGLSNIQFIGAVPKSRMPEVVNASDVGAAVLQNNPTFRTVYPNKVFDYMACARPVLLGIDGAARRMVCDQAQAGVYATAEDDAALAQAITTLAASPDERLAMGRRGRQWVVENVAPARLAQRYLGILEELVRPTRPEPELAATR
jgi:glycosyltransferase involved in cell wall biosynthesis